MRQPPRPIVKKASGMQERCAWFPNICVKIYLLMLFKCIAKKSNITALVCLLGGDLRPGRDRNRRHFSSLYVLLNFMFYLYIILSKTNTCYKLGEA